MKADQQDTPSVNNVNGKPVDMVIYMTIADTTWRMFVPVLLGALLGYVVDKWLASRPIGVISGLGIGIVLAVLLVVMQYKRIARQQETKQ